MIAMSSKRIGNGSSDIFSINRFSLISADQNELRVELCFIKSIEFGFIVVMLLTVELNVVNQEVALGHQFECLAVFPRDHKEKEPEFAFALGILQASEHRQAHLFHRFFDKRRVHLVAALGQNLEVQGVALRPKVFVHIEQREVFVEVMVDRRGEKLVLDLELLSQ